MLDTDCFAAVQGELEGLCTYMIRVDTRQVVSGSSAAAQSIH